MRIQTPGRTTIIQTMSNEYMMSLQTDYFIYPYYRLWYKVYEFLNIPNMNIDEMVVDIIEMSINSILVDIYQEGQDYNIQPYTLTAYQKEVIVANVLSSIYDYSSIPMSKFTYLENYSLEISAGVVVLVTELHKVLSEHNLINPKIDLTLYKVVSYNTIVKVSEYN